MPEPVPDLQGFAARLANGPAFLILSRSADRDESSAAEYCWSGIYTTRTDAAVAAQFRTDSRTVRPAGRARPASAALARRLDQAARQGADYMRTGTVGDTVVGLFKRRSPGQ
jgi:hypothetical protein